MRVEIYGSRDVPALRSVGGQQLLPAANARLILRLVFRTMFEVIGAGLKLSLGIKIFSFSFDSSH